MKFQIFVVLSLSICLNGLSQVRTPDLRSGKESTTQAGDTLKAVNIRERLVQLAMQNPGFEVAERNVTIAAYNVKKTKVAVLNNIALQGNLNEFSIAPSAGTPNLYPRYNVGVLIPLGLFSTRSSDIKMAKESYNIAVAQKNERFRTIKRVVLSKYEDYLLTKNLRDLQVQVTAELYSNYLKTEKDFSEAKVSGDDYTTAYKNYYTELARQKSIERDLQVIILEMEEYIATDFNTVLKEYR